MYIQNEIAINSKVYSVSIALITASALSWAAQYAFIQKIRLLGQKLKLLKNTNKHMYRYLKMH